MADSPSMQILVIEDDPEARANLGAILELDHHAVTLAPTAREGLEAAGRSEFDAILVDRRLPDATSLEVLMRLSDATPLTPLIVITGFGEIEGAIEAIVHGASDYILKPINPDALRTSLARIAERRRLLTENCRSELAFRSLLDVAECIVLIMRPDLTVEYLSPFTERLLGVRQEEVRGRSAVEVFRTVRDPLVTEEVVRRLLARETIRGLEEQIVLGDGSRRWVVWNASLLEDYEGGLAVLAVAQDISGVKLAQERVLQAERLAAIGQMVTGLAHESRNALQRSQACLEMLAIEVADRPRALALIERLQAAQNDLTHLYEDVRGYAAPLRLELETCRLDAVWREAWAELQTQAARCAATLLEREERDDSTCVADPFRMGQVFRNVLENSLSASAPPIRIEVGCRSTQLDGRPALEVTLRDHGPGLPPETHQRLFDPFYTTKIKGTGLGMAIVRRIVEAHGGTVSAHEPDDGPGTLIAIVLPRERP